MANALMDMILFPFHLGGGGMPRLVGTVHNLALL
jgi:hypothetical protein